MTDEAKQQGLTAAIVLIAALVIAGIGAASWAGSGSGSTGAAPASVTVQDEDGDDGAGTSARDVAPVDCEDARTHGEYVSSVARSTPGGPGKGAIVSAAARSDCGKASPE